MIYYVALVLREFRTSSNWFDAKLSAWWFRCWKMLFISSEIWLFCQINPIKRKFLVRVWSEFSMGSDSGFCCTKRCNSIESKSVVVRARVAVDRAGRLSIKMHILSK